MNIQEYIVEVLKREVKPAVGCTEPVAVALNVAHAVDLIPESSRDISKIDVEVSKGIYKNGMDVGIPNTDKIGLDVAASLGAAAIAPKTGLQILGEISKEQSKLADEILDKGIIDVKVADNNEVIYIKTTAKTKEHTAVAVTKGKHDRVVYLELDGKVILEEREELTGSNSGEDLEKTFYKLPIMTLVEEIEKLDYKEIDFLLEGVDMNMEVAKEGLKVKRGLGVGHSYHKNMEKGLVSKDLSNLAYMLTAAASDVRMSGVPMAVMSSSGSGNNGLTAILPLAAFKEVKGDVEEEEMVKALAISHIITSYVKKYIGRLSNLCGCNLAASIGAGSAIAWLLSDKNAIPGTINNIIANQSGVICDGAKPGCALKLGTAASTAVQSALIAIEGTEIKDGNGIVGGKSPEESIMSLSKLSSQGMKDIDETVIEIMLDR